MWWQREVQTCQCSLGKGQDWLGVLDTSGARASLGREIKMEGRQRLAPSLPLGSVARICEKLRCGAGGAGPTRRLQGA